MNAVVERAPPTQPDQVPAATVTSESSALISMIERAARDPSVDIDKMERLMKMHEAALARTAKASYDASLAAMQPVLPVIGERGTIKDRNGNVQSTYALWEDINEAIKPVLASHGFALSFRSGQQEGKIVVTGILSHRDGHREETTMHLPVDATGSKNAVQAVGSSTSYGKRYTASALLNLTSRGEDDDGKAGGAKLISEEQAGELVAMIQDIGGAKHEALKKGFLKYMKVDAIADIPEAKYADAVAALNAKREGASS
jgi:hypothetical protein